MRKWRPSHRCIYVIPEILGNATSLLMILERILPLRKFVNQEDQLIFLGNYIDGDEDGPAVLDMLINIKKEYGDRIVFLKGKQDELFHKAILGSQFNFNDWMNAGGHATLADYTKRSKTSYNISHTNLKDIVPVEHKDFLSSLESFYMLEPYMFFSGSFDPKKTIAENSVYNFIFDDSASKYVKECIKQNKPIELLDDYIFVGGRNFNSKVPFIHQRYMMLGGSAPAKLLVFELNSMTASAATKNKQRIYKYNFKVVE